MDPTVTTPNAESVRNTYRVTIRSSHGDLRGFVDSIEAANSLAIALDREGWVVIASPVAHIDGSGA
jgi:hypothetical protein